MTYNVHVLVIDTVSVSLGPDRFFACKIFLKSLLQDGSIVQY